MPDPEVVEPEDAWSSNAASGAPAVTDETVFVEGVIRWDRVKLQRLVDHGLTGRLFRATLDEGEEPLLLRRHGVQYLALHTHTELVDQINAVRECNHPHLLAFLGLASDGMRNYGTLMEYMPRSLSRVVARAEESEETSKKLKAVWHTIVLDIAGAIEYLHTRKLGHYALHPRNVLFDSAMTVKLSDYGRSPSMITAQLEEGQQSSTPSDPAQGEPRQLYLAPELLRLDAFHQSADVWSLACIMTRLASLQPLYHQAGASTHHIIMMRIAAGDLGPADQLEKVENLRGGPKLIALVRTCSRLEPRERPSIEMIIEELKNLTTRQKTRRASEITPHNVEPAHMPAPGAVPLLQDKHNERKSGKHHKGEPGLTDHALDRCRQAFEKFDTSKNGSIDAVELCEALAFLGLQMHPTQAGSEVAARRVMKKYDTDGTGSLDMIQFSAVVTDLQRYKSARAAKKDKEKKDVGEKDRRSAGHAAAELLVMTTTSIVACSAIVMPAKSVAGEERVFLTLAERLAPHLVVVPVISGNHHEKEEKVFLTFDDTEKVFLTIAPPQKSSSGEHRHQLMAVVGPIAVVGRLGPVAPVVPVSSAAEPNPRRSNVVRFATDVQDSPSSKSSVPVRKSRVSTTGDQKRQASKEVPPAVKQPAASVTGGPPDRTADNLPAAKRSSVAASVTATVPALSAATLETILPQLPRSVKPPPQSIQLSEGVSASRGKAPHRDDGEEAVGEQQQARKLRRSTNAANTRSAEGAVVQEAANEAQIRAGRVRI